MGAFCNIINTCSVALCPSGCEYDSHYNQICCNQGFTLVNHACQDVNECSYNNGNCSSLAKCVNTIGFYNCSCNTGLSGNGTYCTACVPGVCSPLVTCDTKPDGTFACGSCPRGYNGTGIGANGCQDFNECAVRQPSGLCDIHTSCTNSPGSYTCSACPDLYSGQGNETCTPLCGNQVCEPNLGENCVLCPLDCPAPCGQCGDNFCQATSSESCSTCPDDCGPCQVLKCPDASCSHHGTCIQGQCFCTGNWGGPSCSIASGNFSLNVTGAPGGGFTITPTNSSSSQPLVFTISFREIREISESQAIVSSINLTSAAFEFLPYNNTNNSTGNPNKACDNCDLGFYIHTSFSTNNKQFTSSVILNNGAYFELMILDIEDPTTVTFANTSTNFAAKTVKLAAQIRNWPFLALRNSLALILDPVVSGNGASSCVNTQEDENDNLKWVTINYGGISLYGQFTDKMIVDGLFRQVSFKFENANTISAIIPHFWVNAVLDPAFSVLLDPDNKTCGKSKNKKWIKIVAISVPVCVVGVVLLVALLLLAPRIRTYFKVNKWHKREKGKSGKDLKMDDISSSPSSKPLVIDHSPSYEVGTSSGYFSYNPNG